MNAITNRRRAGWNLVGGALLAIVVAAAVLFPGLTPWATPAGATPPPAAQAQACGVHYYALDAPKESKNAFGPSVPARAEATIKSQLHERRLCGTDKLGDPTLTAAHYAGWSAAGLTKTKVSFAGIDAFASKLVADQPMWQSVVTEMESLESASVFSLVAVPAGSRSLYMVPTSGAKGVSTRQGFTVGNGTAVVFTHGNAVVKLRLDCGFQNVRASFPGVPSVPPGSPELPKQPIQPKHPVVVTHRSVCPPGQVLNVKHVCVVPKTGVFQAPGQDNTRDSGVGTKPRVPLVTTPASPPAHVVTSQTGGGGVVDTATNLPGSQTGVSAPGASTTPAPVLTPEPSVNPPTGSNVGIPVNPFP